MRQNLSALRDHLRCECELLAVQDESVLVVIKLSLGVVAPVLEIMDTSFCFSECFRGEGQILVNIHGIVADSFELSLD